MSWMVAFDERSGVLSAIDAPLGAIRRGSSWIPLAKSLPLRMMSLWIVQLVSGPDIDGRAADSLTLTSAALL
jgi:hypothetical protein